MIEGNTAADAIVRRMLAGRTPEERLLMCARTYSTAKALALVGAPHGATQTQRETRRLLFMRFYAGDHSEQQREAILEAIGCL